MAHRSNGAGFAAGLAPKPPEPESSPAGAGAGAGAVLDQAKQGLDQAQRQVRDLIVANPVKALAVALGMGVVFGWLIKRR